MAVNSISQPYEWTFRRVVWATLIFAFVVFCFWLIYRFYQVVFTLFIAIVIGTVIRPIASWLHQRGTPRIAAIILIYLVLLILIMGFLWLLFPLIFEQAATLAGEVPGYYQNLRVSLINSPNQLFARWGELLPTGLQGLTPVPPSDENVV